MRKSLLLAAVVALAPNAALAAEPWETNFRRCEIDKWFTKGEDAFEFDGEGKLLVSIKPADVPAIERGIAVLKKCNKFWACVRERDAGKKRHCYLPKKWTGARLRRRSERGD
jgi:hypothetical protein